MTTIPFDVVARDRASKVLDKVGTSANKTGLSVGKLAKIAAGSFAVKKVVEFGASSVRAFVDAEKSQVRLQDAFRKFPALADTNIDRLGDLNSALAKKTQFDDDATASGQAVLAQFKLTGTQIEQLTPLLQDYAAKTGKDMPTAAQDFGKAVLGQGRALKAIGLNLKDTGSATGNLEQLMGGLRTQVGGFAEKEGTSAAGKAAILSNRFGEIQEAVGAKLLPILSTLADRLLMVADFVDRNASVIGPLVAVLGTLAVGIWAVNAAAKAYAAVQAALNIVMTANPIGLIIAAIALLVVGLVVAYKRSETFRNIVNGVFVSLTQAVGKAVGFMVTGFRILLTVWLTVAGGILKGAAKALGWVPGVGEKLKGAEQAFDNFKGQVLGTLDDIAQQAYGLGEGIGDGMADGLAASQAAVIRAAARLGYEAVYAARKAAQVASPSKATLYVGQMIGEGFVRGLGSKMGAVSSAGSSLGSAALAMPAMPAGNTRGGGAPITFIFPNYIGDKDDLVRAIDTLKRQGRF